MTINSTIDMSTTEISLNGPMVLNDTEWYSMVFSGIPLALFSKGVCACVRTSMGACFL